MKVASRLTRCLVASCAMSMLMIALLSAAVAGASEEQGVSAVGLLVDTGSGEPIHVVVTFAGSGMNAIDVLQEADLDAVTVEFGGLGAAVCEIVETGCDVSSCRQRVCQSGDPESPFWQYWQQSEPGTWAFSQRGGSHVEMRDGDIGAWVWTGTEPDLEPISWETLIEETGAPADLKSPDGSIAAYRSDVPESGDRETGIRDVATAVGVLAVISVAAGVLVLRQRHRLRADS